MQSISKSNTKNSFKDQLLSGHRFLVPGVYDALTARLAERAGFEVIYVTGAGISNAHLGLPDVGLATMNEILDIAGHVAANTRGHLIVDLDTGYGNAINLIRTVQEVERIRVSGIQIEDQVTPKRCGHFHKKEVISQREMELKIRAIQDHVKTDLVVIARTDALESEGMAGALRRAEAYVKAGADALFVEAPASRGELREIASALKGVPLVANIVEGGLTPILPADELFAMGYTIVLHANLVLRANIKATKAVLNGLSEFRDSSKLIELLVSWDERQEIVGLSELQQLEAKYLDLDKREH